MLNRLRHAVHVVLCAVTLALTACSGNLSAASPQVIYLGVTPNRGNTTIDYEIVKFWAQPQPDKAPLVRRARINNPFSVNLPLVIKQAEELPVDTAYMDYPVQVCARLPKRQYVTFTYDFYDADDRVIDSGSQRVYVGDCDLYTPEMPPADG